MKWHSVASLALLLNSIEPSVAGDWPMWRYDAARGASTPHALPRELHLQWTRQLPDPMPAWPATQAKLQFDLQAEPVVMGERIFVPSSQNDSVTAFNTRTGEKLWCFYTDGPVRFAPVAHDRKVFFNSDDGCLYAVDAETGSLIWKVNGAPERRWILGNNRLISLWPSRGGPVLHEGKLYFTASIWPFMGIFIHAVDPDSGEIVWTNSGDGTNYTVQPHSAPAFASVVPQGHLAASGSSLIVPGGRSTPAVYDTSTGDQKYFEFDKRNGGHNVMASGGLLFVAGHAYLMKDGSPVGGGAPAIIDRDNHLMIASDPASILARRLLDAAKSRKAIDRKGKEVTETAPEYHELFRTKLAQSAPGPWHIKAGNQLVAGGKGKLAIYDLGKPNPAWETEIKGEVHTMVAADDRLFVVTHDGLLLCFGSESSEEVAHHPIDTAPLSSEGGQWTEFARRILSEPGAAEGYALVLSIGSGNLIEELLMQSELHVIAVDPNPSKIDSIRRKMETAGLYGKRFSAFVGNPATEKLPPYLCNLITSETSDPAVALHAFSSLRPYGGLAAYPGRLPTISEALPDAEIQGKQGITFVTRSGPIPDSDDWSHQYANAAQTVVSSDANVKAPLGVLWFGGPSHEGVLPRHGHGPSPQVAGGRLFIEGADMLRAVDVYTGRLLWQKDIPGIGTYYNRTDHFAGAGEIGSNYVSLPDRVHAVLGDTILSLDSATGETKQRITLPPTANGQTPFWGSIAVEGDYLIATSTPVATGDEASKSKSKSDPTAEWKEASALIPRHADWHYLAGSDPEEDWAAKHSDSADGWKTGAAGFGYGDNDDKTEIDMRGKFPRVYLRTEVAGQTLRKAGRLALHISYDDAFIAHLNGKEILRRNIKSGVGPNAKGIGSHEAESFETLEIRDWLPLVKDGPNILAIEGHNRSAGSSDFTLDPVLLALKKSPSSQEQKTTKPSDPAPLPTTRYSSGSRRLIVLDRHTGKTLWEREAQFNFRHNNICVSGGRLFCIDKLTAERAASLARRNLKIEGTPTLYALDLKTGKVLWEHDDTVFGTFLNYSAEHDILLQAGSKFRDRAFDDIGRGMMALRGKTGEVIWHQDDLEYSGPCLLWHDRILTNGNGGFAVNLLTGEKLDWTYAREYGCNTAVGSEHLLTFRSGAAGFFDLTHESGTGNLGGFRSSCTNNLLAANGVLNAPDYTRTCTCSYQNQTSLALIHMPEAEFWTYGGKASPNRIGVNFGAPGDRRSEEGTLFVEYPNTGSRSDEVAIEVVGEDIRYRRGHATSIRSGTHPWLTASSIEVDGVISIELPNSLKNRESDIRLWFAETNTKVQRGERVFDVKINGKVIFPSLDLAHSPGIQVELSREYFGFNLGDSVEIELVAKSGSRAPTLSAVEISSSK